MLLCFLKDSLMFEVYFHFPQAYFTSLKSARLISVCIVDLLKIIIVSFVFTLALFFSFCFFRMKCPVSAAQAPSPGLQPNRETSPKRVPLRVDGPDPTRPRPPRGPPLNPTPNLLHTARTLRPPGRYRPVVERLRE